MCIVSPSLLQSFCNKCVRSLVISGIVASVWVIAGCTTTDSIQSDAANEAVDLAWPLPPEQPRIKFIRAFFSEDQIVPPPATMSRLRDSLLGKARESGRQLKKPYAVHADNKGRVFVADSGWGKVLVFDEPNKSFSVWGTEGKGILAKPLGITSDSQGNIYVTDSVKQRVVVYTPDGKFLRAMGRKGELERPIGIAVDEKRNRVYVVDSVAHHIVVYNMTGELLERIGKRGKET
ncbi:MAG: 6-bladed beta-propeller, partial [Gammaproteobacteria bacterium]|nr:6-bladed beta-propeller [Gammaproteobacteria bacterium]